MAARINKKQISLERAIALGLTQSPFVKAPHPSFQFVKKSVTRHTRVKAYTRTETRTVHVPALKRGRKFIRRAYSYERVVRVIHVPARTKIITYEFFVPVLKKKTTDATGTWVSLAQRLKEIEREYDLPRVRVRRFLKWANIEVENSAGYDFDFWGWIKRRPPYPRGLEIYVKVELWFIVYDRIEDAHRFFDASRVISIREDVEQGLWDWDRAVAVRDGLLADVFDKIMSKDYLEVRDVVGWSLYPNADWYNRTVKYRRDDPELQ